MTAEEWESALSPDLPKIKSIGIVHAGAVTSSTKKQFVNLSSDAKWVDSRKINTIERCSQKIQFKVEFDKPGVHNFTVELKPDAGNVKYSDSEKSRNPNFNYQEGKKTYQTKHFLTFVKYTISKFGNILTSFITGVAITDFSANFRAFKREILRKCRINENTNTILLEMILKAKYRGYKIGEVPVLFMERKHGESKLNLFKEAPKFFFKMIKFVFLYRILHYK